MMHPRWKATTITWIELSTRQPWVDWSLIVWRPLIVPCSDDKARCRYWYSSGCPWCPGKYQGWMMPHPDHVPLKIDNLCSHSKPIILLSPQVNISLFQSYSFLTLITMIWTKLTSHLLSSWWAKENIFLVIRICGSADQQLWWCTWEAPGGYGILDLWGRLFCEMEAEWGFCTPINWEVWVTRTLICW